LKILVIACSVVLLLAFGAPIIAAAYFSIVAVGAGARADEYSSAQAQTPPAPASDNLSSSRAEKKSNPLLGVWQGKTLASCAMSIPNRCNAQESVKITLVEGAGSKIGGLYNCSYGNMDCYHQDYTGKVVEAKMNGSELSLRVMMLDGTSCWFNGRVSSDAVNGGYSCSTGASIFEQGTWRAQHLY
jgi:hypothetical protein